MKRSLFALITLVLVLMVAGCMASHYGKKMEASQVNTIKKGVTTRREVEQLFGPPIATNMLPDGRRMLHFTYNESRMKAETVFSLGWVGGADARQQNLQVIVGPNDIVQDYDFSDNTSETKTGPFGTSGQTERSPTPGAGK